MTNNSRLNSIYGRKKKCMYNILNFEKFCDDVSKDKIK